MVIIKKLFKGITISVIWVFILSAGCFAQSVPSDKSSTVTLDASRVKSIHGNTMTYNTGRGDITIRADSFAAQRFVKDVERGRTSARETVRIEPIRKSPFNTQYKTTR